MRIILLLGAGLIVSSCTSLESLYSDVYDNATVTYNVKKNKINAKTKIGKHLVLKY